MENLRRKVEELEGRLLTYEQQAILGKLMACAASEVKSNLEEIKSDLSLSQKKDNGSPETDRSISGALMGLEKLSLAVGSWLSFAQPRTPPGTGDNLLNLIQKAISITMLQATEQQVQVSFQLPSELRRVTLEGELYQVFLGIIKSALEAMPQGGSLKINGKVKPQEIEINFRHDGPLPYPQDESPRSNSPIFTEECSLRLGLPGCETILKRNGGRLSLESRPGLGTKVQVLLSGSGNLPGSP